MKNQYFLLMTHFSVRFVKFMSLTGIQCELDRSNWFIKRSALFKNITYPSILAQKRRPDRWLLFCSEGDEEIFEIYMKGLEEWIIPLYLKTGISVKSQVDSYIYDIIGDDCSMLISRIDSDDAVVPGFYENAYSIAAESEDEELALMYRYGERWDGESVQYMNYRDNPFVSIYVKDWRESRISPLTMKHTDILNYNYRFIDENQQAAWLQVLHGRNVMNEFKEKYGEVKPVSVEAMALKYNINKNSINAIKAMREDV